jgi:hypothetical protein
VRSCGPGSLTKRGPRPWRNSNRPRSWDIPFLDSKSRLEPDEDPLTRKHSPQCSLHHLIQFERQLRVEYALKEVSVEEHPKCRRIAESVQERRFPFHGTSYSAASRSKLVLYLFSDYLLTLLLLSSFLQIRVSPAEHVIS